MERLLLRLTPGPGASWCMSSSPRHIVHGSLDEAARAAAGYQVVVLLPSAELALLSARIPTRQQRRLRQALPYALEEQLAADVETQHFASAGRQGDEVPCAVIDREILRHWLSLLEGTGIKADALTADVLALPHTPGAWTLLAEPTGITLRMGKFSGLGCDADALQHLLPLLLQQAGEQQPTRLHCYHTADSATVCSAVQQWCASAGIEQQTTLIEDGLNILAATETPEVGVNLLQGEFGPREQTRQLWWPWRISAALLAVLLLLQGAFITLRYHRLAQEDELLSARIAEVYRSTFPESKRVVDARAQMEQKLTALRHGAAGQDFHQLISHAAPALLAAGVEPRTLHFAAGALEIEIRARELQALDRLKQSLAKDGMHAELTGADSAGGSVSGHISLRREGS